VNTKSWVIIAPVPHLNKSLARSNKNPFYQGFLTGIATINLREFYYVKHDVKYFTASFWFGKHICCEYTALDSAYDMMPFLAAYEIKILCCIPISWQ